MDSKTPFVILGTGPEARIAADIAHSVNVLIYGFLATEEEGFPEDVHDISVVGRLDSKDARALLKDETIMIGVAEPDITKRRDLVEYAQTYQSVLGNLFHAQCSISEYARVGHGNIIHSGTVIGSGSLFGSFNQLGSNVSLETDVIVGDYCTLQSGAKIGKGAEIADEVFIGMGAVIYAGVKIGEGALIGDGSVVLRDVPAHATVYGNPAEIKK